VLCDMRFWVGKTGEGGLDGGFVDIDDEDGMGWDGCGRGGGVEGGVPSQGNRCDTQDWYRPRLLRMEASTSCSFVRGFDKLL